ncbi:hypothetical protein [Hahella ganghwensis]|uniref:hypothetical protein n=1 Tax=Hahella ganghwensis TaxID=286420 RepID=UPI00036650B7|nr:hypothetical protein [Hahella ganghwensis]
MTPLSFITHKQRLLIPVALISLLTLSGCSTSSNRGMYESIQSSNQFECSKLPLPQYEECMRQNSMDYNEYRREREKVLADGKAGESSQE